MSIAVVGTIVYILCFYHVSIKVYVSFCSLYAFIASVVVVLLGSRIRVDFLLVD